MAEAFAAAVTYVFEAIGVSTVYAEAIGTVLYYAAPGTGGITYRTRAGDSL